MQLTRLGMVLLGLLAFASGSVPIADAQSEYSQCYYKVGLDPAGSCTSCKNICMGSGYMCCEIVPVRPG